MPELPEAKKARFIEQYKLPVYDAGVLTAEQELADFYEAVVAESKGDPKIAANWVIGDLLGGLNKAGKGIEESPVDAVQLAGLLARTRDKTISGQHPKDASEAIKTGKAPGRGN